MSQQIMGRHPVLRIIANAVVGIGIAVVIIVVTDRTVPEHLKIWIIPAVLVITSLGTAATKFVRRRRSVAASVPSSQPEANGQAT
ncbi:hypothetical protein [Actinoplanes sp. NPDC049118]|uniref:hypothetical protein n=1 Tax=Actinoplanes sp. NPDC049118 TaxID=3155769 RepID=UPI0033F97A55